MPAQQLRLEPWANFYVIVSAAAATLLGLLFVVIALAAERGRREDTPKIRIYLTPVVIYFTSALVMSALLTVPSHTSVAAAICVCLPGIAGLVYSGSLAIRRAGSGFYEARSDLFPYVVFPFAAYALVVAGGTLFLPKPDTGLNLVAAGMLVLLCVAIRNSWSIAVTIVSARDRD